MATTMYFEETVVDQGGKTQMEIELGRSSFYAEDSMNVDGKVVTMNRAVATRFVEATQAVGRYHGLIE